MTGDRFEIRVMTRDEFDIVIGWAAAEGWNPGRHDAEVFYAADPAGYYAGLLDGEPIGSISAVKYGAGYVFWGFFIVKPEHALVSRVPAGSPLYIDVPQPNSAAVDLVTRRGMTPMFETARMYRGPHRRSTWERCSASRRWSWANLLGRLPSGATSELAC